MGIDFFDKSLRRFSFADKMMVLSNESYKLNGVIKQKILDNTYYPHEIDFLLFRSIIADEGGLNQEFTTNKLRSLVNNIRNQEFIKMLDTYHLFSSIAYFEFDSQAHHYHLFYMYHYMLNYKDEKTNIQKEFEKFYGCNVMEFIMFAKAMLLLGYKNNLCFNSELRKTIFDKYPNVVKNISMDRLNIINEYRTVYNRDDIYSFFDLNILYKYPIIIYNSEYFVPSVHFISLACSRTLKYRLTDNNDDLNTEMGKVFENYVQHILTSCSVYKNSIILPEFKYSKGKDFADHSIILEDKVILFEDKNISPNLKNRKFDENIMKATKDRLSKQIVQVYRKMYALETGKVHNGNFPEKINYIYGVVLIANTYYCDYSKLYDAAYLEINKSINENITREELVLKVLIISIDALEEVLENNKGGILAIFEERQRDSRQLYNYFYNHISDKDKDYNGLPIKKDFNKKIDDMILKKLKNNN